MTETNIWVRVAHLDDIPEGEMMAVTVGKRRIAIYHLETGEVRASDNVCTHEFALLTDGWLEGCEVECPLHAGRFDVRSGKARCLPASKDLQIYDARLVEGEIHIGLPSSEG